MRALFVIFMLVFALAAFSAGSDDTVLSFSTRGPDRYADGTTVLDGECYALVWSKDGVFDGFSASGQPLDTEDKVVIVAPIATGGRCPDVNFQIDAAEAAANSGGKYAVYLLDTRVQTGDTVRPCGAISGVPALNGYGVVTEGEVSVGAFDVAKLTGSAAVDGRVACVTASVPENRAQPRVKSFRVVGDSVYLAVEDLGGYLRVQHGDDVSVSGGTGVAHVTDGTQGDVVLVAPKRGGSGFYRVVRN